MVGLMDSFNSWDVFKVLRHKFVIIIGDSIHRSIYKDLVLLLQEDRYLSQDELRSKGEFCFMNDELIEGGLMGEVSNGIRYREVRQFRTDQHFVRFYFVTRCYNAYVEGILLDIQERRPDVVLMNSCVWDITRYGPKSIMDLKENIVSLFSALQQTTAHDRLVIWNTTLPVSQHARGGFLPSDKEFQHSVLSADINAANEYTKRVASSFNGIQILDLHSHLKDHRELQVQDGIHWDMMAHRFITNLVMELISDFFGAQVHRRSARTRLSRPLLNSLTFNSPMRSLPCYRGDTPANTPINRRRGRCAERSNYRFENIGHFQNSFDCQSPYSDASESEFHHDFHSPFQFQSPIYIFFEKPDFSDTPIQFQTCNYFYSPPNDFESPRSHSENNPCGYLSPINNQSPIPSPCSSPLSPCRNDRFYRSNSPTFNSNNRNGRRVYNSLSNNGVPSFMDRANLCLNLGQYVNQGESTGVIRRSGRRGRQHQPYKGNHFR